MEQHSTNNKRHYHYRPAWDEQIFDEICRDADAFWADQRRKRLKRGGTYAKQAEHDLQSSGMPKTGG
jgi:hypothetical protein